MQQNVKKEMEVQGHKSNHSEATIHKSNQTGPSQSYALNIIARFCKARNSIFGRDDSSKRTRQISTSKSSKTKTNSSNSTHKKSIDKPKHLPVSTLNIQTAGTDVTDDSNGILYEDTETPALNHQNSRFSIASNSTVTTIGSNDGYRKYNYNQYKRKNKHSKQFSRDDSYLNNKLTLQNINNRMSRSQSRSSNQMTTRNDSRLL